MNIYREQCNTLNVDNMKLETTANTTTFIKQLTECAKYYVDNKDECLRLNFYDGIGDWDKYKIQSMYANVRMIHIHEYLRSDQYTEKQKIDLLKPFIAPVYGDSDEELQLLIDVSKEIDLINEIVVDQLECIDFTKEKRDVYFIVLEECANLMIDEELDKAREDTGYKKLEQSINKHEKSKTLSADEMLDLIRSRQGYKKSDQLQATGDA